MANDPQPDRPVLSVPNAYGALAALIQEENPYGKKIILKDISSNIGNTAGERPEKLETLARFGIQVMGWLRGSWEDRPKLSCNHRMTVQEKQQSYYWTTLYPEDPTPEYPNDSNAEPAAFERPEEGQPVLYDNGNPVVFQNSADVQVHQVCKAIYVPFEYEAEDGRILEAAFLVGYVGAGGGQ